MVRHFNDFFQNYKGGVKMNEKSDRPMICGTCKLARKSDDAFLCRAMDNHDIPTSRRLFAPEHRCIMFDDEEQREFAFRRMMENWLDMFDGLE